MDGIRAGVFGNAHPHFVYVHHHQVPKPYCLELNWRLRHLGLPHILKCQVEQAVTIQTRAPGWRGRVLEGWWRCGRDRGERRRRRSGWWRSCNDKRGIGAPLRPVVLASKPVILGSTHGHAGEREARAARGARRGPRRAPEVEPPASSTHCQRGAWNVGTRVRHEMGCTHVRLEGRAPASMTLMGLPYR